MRRSVLFMFILWCLAWTPAPQSTNPWKTPFLTDTLFVVTGGPFAVVRSFMPAPDDGHGGYYPAYTQFKPDTLVTLHGSQDYLIAHEAGHMLDARNVAPFVLADVAARMSEYKRGDYFASSPNEYVAEAFGRAILSARKSFADSLEVDRRFPGSIQVIRWLQTQPLFSSK